MVKCPECGKLISWLVAQVLKTHYTLELNRAGRAVIVTQPRNCHETAWTFFCPECSQIVMDDVALKEAKDFLTGKTALAD